MSYEPRGRVANLVLAMRNRPAHLFDSKESALILEVGQAQVGAYVTTALSHGAMFSKQIRGRVYFKGTPITEQDVSALCAKLDGDKAAAHGDVRAPGPSGFVPKPMVAPRPGSEMPRLAAASAPAPVATPTPTPIPTPAPTQPPMPPAPEPEAEAIEVAEEVVEAVAPVEFNASHWLDGDLVIYGATELEDGGMLITKEQLGRLKRLIAWSSV